MPEPLVVPEPRPERGSLAHGGAAAVPGPVPFPIKRHGDSSPFVEIAIPGRTIFTFSLDIAGAYPWRRRPSTYPRYGLQTRRSMPDAPRALPRGLAAPTRGAGKPRCRMAYDEDLADRIRELIADEPDVTEQRMFGGLAFLVGGNMAVAASGQGGLMVRIDPEDTDALVAKPHAQPFEMRGRAMRGWLLVGPEGVRTKRGLQPWVRRGVAYARSLPPKR
jgi:TfoX/Sxy family transcriptional regulator of competence genes